MLMRMRFPGIAIWLFFAAASAAVPASAAETGNGSKNFRAPAAVPNFFANEAGPLLGGAAESRRGELYYGQANPQQHQVAAIPAVPRVAVAPSRGREVHSARRGGRVQVAHAVHGRRDVHRAVAHASVTRHGPVAARARTTRVSSNHHRGRG